MICSDFYNEILAINLIGTKIAQMKQILAMLKFSHTRFLLIGDNYNFLYSTECEWQLALNN